MYFFHGSQIAEQKLEQVQVLLLYVHVRTQHCYQKPYTNLAAVFVHIYGNNLVEEENGQDFHHKRHKNLIGHREYYGGK